MRSYWAEGHNQSYILLRILVERRQVVELLGDKVQRRSDDNEDDEVEAFSQSFVNRGKKIWNTLMSPYRRDDEDVNEFIADDNDVEDEEVETQRPVFEKPESDIEDAFVKHLREKRLATKHGYDTSSNEEDDSSSEDESIGVVDDDDSDYDGIVEEEEKEESSEDEWVAKKSYKSKSPWKKSKIQQGRKTNRLMRSNATYDSDDEEDGNSETSPSNTRRSAASGSGFDNDEDDDEDDDNDEDFVPSSAVKRKRNNQFLSSDEE